MLLFNIVLVLILLAFIGLGLKDGFIHAFGRIVGAVIGFVAARAWYLPAAQIFSKNPSGWTKVIAFLFIFLLITRLLGWVFKTLDATYKFIAKLPFMKSFNSLLGALLGFIEGLVILGGFFWINMTFSLLPFINPLIAGSGVANWIYKAFTMMLGMLL